MRNPGLKPDDWSCNSFRDAKASLPLLKQGAPTDFSCKLDPHIYGGLAFETKRPHRFCNESPVGAPAFMRGSSAFQPSGSISTYSTGFSRGLSLGIAVELHRRGSATLKRRSPC